MWQRLKKFLVWMRKFNSPSMVELPTRTLDQIHETKWILGQKTNAEIITQAVRVYEFLLKKEYEGSQVGYIDHHHMFTQIGMHPDRQVNSTPQQRNPNGGTDQAK